MRKHLEGISQPELSKSLKAVFHFGVTVAKMTVLLQVKICTIIIPYSCSCSLLKAFSTSVIFMEMHFQAPRECAAVLHSKDTHSSRRD